MHSTGFLKIGLIGINYKTADLPLRETLAKAAESLAGEKALFFRYPTVLLNTCNRTEIYFASEDLSEAHQELLSLLRKRVDLPFEQKLYSLFGFDCFVHLCRVASGLDSAILAESEIQRQVKMAYLRSKEVLALPGPIHYIFQKALRVSKGIRNHLTIDRNAPTLFGTLWQISNQTLGDLSQRKILLIGNSEINRGFASFLERHGILNITVCTKEPSKIKGPALDRKDVGRWGDYDLILAASRADQYLISGKSKEKHLIFDLSVPRNVDPEIGRCPNVRLYNIEEIDKMIEQKRVARKESLEECEEKVVEHVFRLASLYRRKVTHKEIYALEL